MPGTACQVAAAAEQPLDVVGATLPVWPGAGEADVVDGPWRPTLEPAPL